MQECESVTTNPHSYTLSKVAIAIRVAEPSIVGSLRVGAQSSWVVDRLAVYATKWEFVLLPNAVVPSEEGLICYPLVPREQFPRSLIGGGGMRALYTRVRILVLGAMT